MQGRLFQPGPVFRKGDSGLGWNDVGKERDMHVVICGAGVIGASTAYFLSLRGAEVTVVERASVACAASGKSGGFLALDWCDGSPLAPLARRSFELHGTLASQLDGDWGYRRLDTFGLLASDSRDLASYRQLPTPDWLGNETAVHGQLGTTTSTAQVQPGEFTKAMMRAAEANGATLRIGAVEGVTLDDEGSRVTGVGVDGESLAADAVVIAMGPWSVLACQWLPLPGVYGLKGHSFVFRYQPPDDPRALFVEYEAARGEVDSPEVFPRDDGTTYVCGARGHDPLPVDPEHIGIEAEPAERLLRQIQRFAPDLAASEILATQACYRPVTEDGLPLIGPVPGITGGYIATGHSVWGILNAPATGEAMAELLLDGQSGLDLTAFDPGRLGILQGVEVDAG
jgi:glycine/D-amino acid oxidase-like deaminating enzyme